MSLAVLEMNDQSLLIQTDGGVLFAEPGFACLTAEGIETGESAHALAWRQPQHGYNQYWSQLNQAPLAAKHQWARHYADIAFAQLKHLWQSAGSPQSLIALVPGSFSDDQVSLLLGMIKIDVYELEENFLGIPDDYELEDQSTAYFIGFKK